MTPLISVIIPCYNLGAYVDEAIQSVLAQTVQDFEILVVDDGSTDEDTVKILKSGSWPRTQIFRTPNCGLACARNMLVQRSTGRFSCALDADDKLHPQYFEKTLAAFDAEPELTFVSTRLQMFGEQTLVAPMDLRCDLPTLLMDCPIFPAALVRREAVLSIGGYDEQMPAQGDEDWDFWISLLERGHRGLILPEILFYYRRRSGSLCEGCTTGETHLRLMEYLTRKHEAAFRAYLEEALLLKDRLLSEQLGKNWQVEREISDHRAAIARRRAELTSLQETLVAKSAQERRNCDAALLTMQREYSLALEEIANLRASRSWKVTAPLRTAIDVLRRLRSGSS